MSKYNAQYFVIPRSVGAVALQLGYSDENGGYGDNGYWGHNAGNFDQCKNVEKARVQIQVNRSCEIIKRLPNGSVENCFYATPGLQRASIEPTVEGVNGDGLSSPCSAPLPNS